jgi:predicted ATPase/DNA-binding CsgD family transcriptional regulator
VAPAPAVRASLPAELTEFVGRRQDRADVRRLMSESRLVTLTGMGGVGKTRLALRAAADLQRTMRDGVCFVPLAELSDPGLIVEATAAALGIHDRSSEFGMTRLSEYLRDSELLLVLDNCEHLIDDCALLADTLLRTCPRLRILATSRETLRIAGEAIHPIAPLSVPHEDAELGTLQEYEAVRLFLERVRQVVPDFTIDVENRQAVLDICRHLEGIPLALELAAVRLRAMSPDQLLERLRDHWQMLDLGSRNAPERHRTMSACIEWSYAQCSPSERQLWERLSIFAGGAEMDAVEHVAASIELVALPESGADLAQALVDKSILSVDRTDGRAHFRMHEVLRQFGTAQLESTELLTSSRRALRSFYTDLLGRIDDAWMSPQQIDWMRRMRREDANLRIALEFSCTEPGEAPAGLALAARLRKYAMAYGTFTEVRHWLRRLLALVPDADVVRLRGLRAACTLAALQGDRTASGALLAEARDLAGHLPSSAAWLVDQAAGWHHMFAGDLDACLESLEHALVVLEPDGNLRDIAETHTLIGMARGFADDLPGAAAAHDKALTICEATGESWCRSFSLWHLGLVRWAGGDLDGGLELERQSLGLKRRMDERLGLALCLEASAWMHMPKSPRRSATLLGAADRLWHVMATSLEVLPGLTLMRQDCEVAAQESLGSVGFRTSYAVGAGMEPSTAIAYALDEKRSSDVSAGVEADRLTKRERQVAELVATGLTNQEIASKLVLSRRTVEGHVEHALTKLGFTSRTQLAVWLSDQSGPSAAPLTRP